MQDLGMSGIKMTTSQKAIDNLFRDAAKIVSEEIINTLTYLGEQCVVKIRDRSGEDSWFDQTGNLRSSIGYGIYSYGRKQISSAFAQVLEGASGAAEGKKMIEELASHYATAYALVCVAAMSYAEYVEADRRQGCSCFDRDLCKGKGG